MNRINLRTLDLNLLRILVELSETASVSGSAVRLGLSQPAVSNALGRLRDATGDPLFVRTKRGMIPTSYAETILPGVRNHLSGIFEVLGSRSDFDPGASRRTFRLSLSGLGELVFLPRLAETAFGSAPNTRLQNVSVPVDQLADALENGQIDCAIGIISIRARGIRTLPLFRESYVAIVGAAFRETPNTVGDLRHERLAVSAPAVSYAEDIANLIERHDLGQSIALQLANFGALPQLLGTLPLVAIVPRQYAVLLEQGGNARLLPIEFGQPESVAQLVWSEKTEADEACRWLRACIIEQFADP